MMIVDDSLLYQDRRGLGHGVDSPNSDLSGEMRKGEGEGILKTS